MISLLCQRQFQLCSRKDEKEKKEIELFSYYLTELISITRGAQLETVKCCQVM